MRRFRIAQLAGRASSVVLAVALIAGCADEAPERSAPQKNSSQAALGFGCMGNYLELADPDDLGISPSNVLRAGGGEESGWGVVEYGDENDARDALSAMEREFEGPYGGSEFGMTIYRRKSVVYLIGIDLKTAALMLSPDEGRRLKHCVSGHEKTQLPD